MLFEYIYFERKFFTNAKKPISLLTFHYLISNPLFQWVKNVILLPIEI
jgi:hypothetical protein